MHVLNRYISRQIAVPALLALLLVGFLGVATEIRDRVDDFRELPLSEITVGDAARIGALFLPATVTYVVPITFMMGILLAFSRLAQQNEITAMKAAGIPLKRVILPVLIVGAILSGLMYAVQDQVQPWALRQLSQILYSDLPLRATLDVLPTGVMHDYGDWRVYIGERDPATGSLKDIRILEASEDGSRAFYAASAEVVKTAEGSSLVMYDVEVIPASQAIVTQTKTSIPIPPLQPKQAGQTRKGYTLRELLDFELLVELTQDLQRAGLFTDASLQALAASRGVMAKTGFPPEIVANYPAVLHIRPEWLERLERYRGEQAKAELAGTRWDIAERTAIPFSCLAVCLAAAPLAVRNRGAGRSYAFLVGVLVLGVYFVLFQALQPRGLHTLPTMVLRAWVPNLALMAGGLFFLWRVDRV